MCYALLLFCLSPPCVYCREGSFLLIVEVVFMKLSEIKRLMAPVLDLSMARGEFQIGDTVFKVRTTLPVEDLQTQRFAIDAAEDEEGMVASLPYIDAHRNRLIATCITHIGDLCVEDHEFLETGDLLPDGTPVKVSRIDAIYRMVSDWGREFQILAFLKIYDIVSVLEQKQKALINYEPVDMEVEVKQLESRIQFLQKRIEERKEQAMNTRKIDLDIIRNHHLVLEDEAPEEEEEVVAPQTPAEPPPTPPVQVPPAPVSRPSGSLIPDSVPPPAEVPSDLPPSVPPEDPRFDFAAPSSLMSSGSEDDEILAESQRIMARRQAAIAQENVDAGVVVDNVPQGRTNPRFRK